ncbi:aromatic ring-hydroxylating dioxygenase subunit alpha [Croceicoccus mobilis]|uniref:(2Fe-2S)-binding protein n=1 Tax=Croceicoccus mobilis TaxID=1703339 RepID=A0A916Z5U4_9SPHN|nr:aromatic ring-hydroxylating dioxygenase subunit alpha [Croceicoccus mobilis]GGD77234.1 (2Fe-2S)-binding protein [Croceicoccus mobilis]
MSVPVNLGRAVAKSDEIYPLQASRFYPKEQWYVGAYKSELVEGQTLARTIFGERVIFFRGEGGKATAVSNLCVHRFMPLDEGKIVDGRLVCPYHGYAYGEDGRCVHVPTGGAPSPHARLRHYPVREDGPFVWIWTGSVEGAGEVDIPDLTDIGLSDASDGWTTAVAERLHMQARAPLLVDNLFDLSHIAFIHVDSLPGAGGLAMIPPMFDRKSDRFRVGRYVPNFVAKPDTVIGDTMPMIVGQPVYAALLTDFYSPAVINSSGPWANELVDGDQPGESIAKLNFVHLITPETENSTHYFNVVTRDYHPDDESLSARLIAQTDRVRREDVGWLEQIEKIADRMSAKGEISSKADEGSLKVRRHLRSIIEAELAVSAAE